MNTIHHRLIKPPSEKQVKFYKALVFQIIPKKDQKVWFSFLNDYNLNQKDLTYKITELRNIQSQNISKDIKKYEKQALNKIIKQRQIEEDKVLNSPFPDE